MTFLEIDCIGQLPYVVLACPFSLLKNLYPISWVADSLHLVSSPRSFTEYWRSFLPMADLGECFHKAVRYVA